MPDSADQTSQLVVRIRKAAMPARPRPSPSSRARRQAADTPAAWKAMPRSLVQASTFPGSGKSRESSAVQSGAVEPVTSSPGLYDRPQPAARLRANWRWIQLSSRGNPSPPTRKSSAPR
jgi:hypothetical protein